MTPVAAGGDLGPGFEDLPGAAQVALEHAQDRAARPGGRGLRRGVLGAVEGA